MNRSIEVFIFASLLNLNMGYCHIKLDSDAQTLWKIIFPWGEIKIQTLTHEYQDCLVAEFFKK
jgi:hypothetical protein